MNRTPKPNERRNVPIDQTTDMIMDTLDELKQLDQKLREYAGKYKIPEIVMPSFSYSRRSLTTAINHLHSAKTICDTIQ